MNVTIETTVSASVEAVDLARVLTENAELFVAVWNHMGRGAFGGIPTLEHLGKALADAQEEGHGRRAFAAVYDSLRFHSRRQHTLKDVDAALEGIFNG